MKTQTNGVNDVLEQGIEFVLAGEHTYPDDYPEVNDEICVVGVFDTYQAGPYTCSTLRNAKYV